jgi:putative oxidoreductase
VNRPTYNTGFMLPSWAPYILSVLRVVAALLFFEHGTQKLFGYPPGPPFTGFPNFSMLGIGGMIEVAGGFLLLIGLFTRPTAFIVCGEMAVAYFRAHRPRGFFPILNGGEITVLLCFVFLYLIFAGPGPLSLDYLLRPRGPRRR